MKFRYIYFIYYRDPEGQILKYITDSPELYTAELNRLREDGIKIVRHWRERI